MVLGDFNIAPEDRDVHDPAAWAGDALFRPETAEKFHALLNLGLTDAYRACHDESHQYTFWDYQRGSWRKDHGIRISMDGKGAWRDNVFIERLWRSVKYEEVYLHAYDTVSDSRASIGKYFNLYNRRRPHSSLKRKTPDQVYYSQQPLTLAA